MRYSSLKNPVMLAFLFGALVVLVVAMWISSNGAVSGNAILNGQKKSYLQQISDLKKTLELTQQSFEHEHKLAVGLQRELRDAHNQIAEISQKLDALQKKKAQTEERLQVVSQALSANKPVVVVTQSPTILTNSDSSFGRSSSAKHAHIAAKISPYAPSSRTIVKAKPVSNVRQKQHSMVATLAPAETPSGGKRVKRSAQMKALRSSLGAATRNRKVKAKLRRVVRLKARSGQNSPVHRSNRTVKHRPPAKRSRVKKPNLFNRLARQGVFGSGYFVE